MKTTILLSVIWVCCTVAAILFKEADVIWIAFAGTMAYLLFLDD